ncbi:velvet factor-domain-containing protein [Aspergillus karnatakaensis]|uniref:velvet factor family protein n=1 Tax=Aspergillus karnatakaensis TaxID=1810916 RepID=UPI003CCCD35D
MIAYGGAQFADSSRHGQKHTLCAGNTIQIRESSLLPMSGAPFQQWAYSSDGKHSNARPRPFEEDPSGQAPVINNAYLEREVPPFHFQYPAPQNHEPAVMQNLGHPRLPTQSRSRDYGNNHRYRQSSTPTGSLAHYSIQPPGISRNVEYTGSAHSYFDAPSRGRGSVGSAGRTNDVDSQYSSSSTTFPSPVHSDKSPRMYPTLAPLLSNYQLPSHQRHNTASMPSGFEHLLHRQTTPSPPPKPRSSAVPRFSLHIRQQPIAARACGAGDRDRRPVDPPPIIQMILMHADPSSEDGRSILQDPRFTVGCLLYPVQDSAFLGSPTTEEGKTDLGINFEDSNAPGQATPLLSGKAFVSPFYVDEEPDPKTAPPLPKSSSQSHFPETTTLSHVSLGQSPQSRPPVSFFIFSDLSVRKAGLYRLQFRLMNWGAVEDTGQSMPILAEAWSEPFRVWPAKDFPGMRDSSDLTLRLKELGFVELKTRGNGMGKGRRVGKAEARS